MKKKDQTKTALRTLGQNTNEKMNATFDRYENKIISMFNIEFKKFYLKKYYYQG